MLAVDPRTVMRLIQTGGLPALKVGAQWRIRDDDLEEFLAQRHNRGGSGSGS